MPLLDLITGNYLCTYHAKKTPVEISFYQRRWEQFSTNRFFQGIPFSPVIVTSAQNSNVTICHGASGAKMHFMAGMIKKKATGHSATALIS